MLVSLSRLRPKRLQRYADVGLPQGVYRHAVAIAGHPRATWALKSLFDWMSVTVSLPHNKEKPTPKPPQLPLQV